MRRIFGLACLVLVSSACTSPARPQPPVTIPAAAQDAGSAAPAAPVAEDVVADASLPKTPVAPQGCPIQLVLTRNVPSLTHGTFMLRPEQRFELEVDGFGPAVSATRPWTRGNRIKGGEAALERLLAPLLGDSATSIVVKYEGPAGDAGSGDRLSFTIRGTSAGYATCHGLYDTKDWSGSFSLATDGTLEDMTLTGTSSLREDICNPANGGRTRLTSGVYRATMRGKLEPICAGVSDP